MNRVFFAMVLIAFVAAAAMHVLWQTPLDEASPTITRVGSETVILGGERAFSYGSDWREIPTPPVPRTGHSASAIGDDLLVVGGMDADLRAVADVRWFDTAKRLWLAGVRLPAPRRGHHAVPLPDDQLLVVGGSNGDGEAAAQVWTWSPTARAWRREAALPTPRNGSTATLLDPNGDEWVIVTGGSAPGDARQRLRVVEGLSRQAQEWVELPSLPLGLAHHAAVALPDGRLLVIGGIDETGEATASAWAWAPGWPAWRAAGEMAMRRAGHTASVLADGRVVVVGGTETQDGAPSAAEVFYPGADVFTRLAPPPSDRDFAVAAAYGGTVVVGGGLGGTGLDELDVAAARWRRLAPPTPMARLGIGMIDSAGSAVTLAISLIGVMTLFLGLMKVAEAGGLLTILSKLIRPLMVRLFPDVPADHPAMGAMILNMAANAMGLANAATPFGIRAMQELDTLNRFKGSATNAMCLFLAINTSSVTILPTGVIALRASLGSTDPAGILYTTLFATICSTTVAIIGTKLYQRLAPAQRPLAESELFPAELEEDAPPVAEPLPEEASAAYPLWVSLLALAGLFSILPLSILFPDAVGEGALWVIPGLMMALLGFGFVRGVAVYEAFVHGARDGFQVAVKIIPYLVGILVAVAMFRYSGALEFVIDFLGPATSAVGLPAEALPMALLRPLSGSGAYGVAASIMTDPATGPDTYVGYLVSTFQGSTETTFYVIAVYFGAVRVRAIRHAMVAALTADVAGIAAAVLICWWLFG